MPRGPRRHVKRVRKINRNKCYLENQEINFKFLSKVVQREVLEVMKLHNDRKTHPAGKKTKSASVRAWPNSMQYYFSNHYIVQLFLELTFEITSIIQTKSESLLILKFFVVLFKQLFCNFPIFVELMQKNSAEFIFLVRVEGS